MATLTAGRPACYPEDSQLMVHRKLPPAQVLDCLYERKDSFPVP